MTGQDLDTSHHFAGLDYDWKSDTYHAQYRQYSPAAGRWMSPDLYSGSYDPANPQSFNRYSYVLNNPLAFTDPQGLDDCNGGGDRGDGGNGGGGSGGLLCLLEQLGQDIAGLFSGPGFHGSLKPRPNNNPWSEYSGISYGPDIAGALGLPDEQCDFGVCGTGSSSFQSADDLAWPAASLCIQNLQICAALGGAALRIGLAPVATTITLLSMEGDNQPKPSDAVCRQIVEEAKRTCTSQYPFPGRDNQLGKWRTCVRRIVEPTGCDF